MCISGDKIKHLWMAGMILSASTLFADVAPNKQHEIQHLLDFVKNSACMMNRNSSKHKTVDAVNHIQRKYNHFRKEIHSTEDFIRLSASKSTMSGKFYTVKCPGFKQQQTRAWLLKELEMYRVKRRY